MNLSELGRHNRPTYGVFLNLFTYLLTVNATATQLQKIKLKSVMPKKDLVA